jgi:alpha-methylacyl-CoA racemase
MLAAMVMALRAQGLWSDQRQSNLLDGAAPFYDTYPCADGAFVAVGALEARFFQALLDGLGLDDIDASRQLDPTYWPLLRERIGAAFAQRTRDEWVALFAGTEACVTPVLTFGEAVAHPHLAARQTYTDVDGITQSATAPRFSRTPGATRHMTPDSLTAAEVLADWR